MSYASCIMPTANRREFVPAAIRMFLAQDYSDAELIVVDDGRDSVADLVPQHSRIRYIREDRNHSIGAKRNVACEAAHGDVILHWDDDDWYSTSRIRKQMEALLQSGADICGADRAFFVDCNAHQAWEYIYPPGGPAWLCGATLCYRKSFWRSNRFPEVNIGEDTRFIFAARGARIHALDDNRFFVGRIHPKNSSPKQTRDQRWQPRRVEDIRAIVGYDWTEYFEDGSRLVSARAPRGTALITAASGIGDIIRVTPLIRVAHRLGYDVDVVLAPDDPAAAELIRGAPEIRRLLLYPDITTNRGNRPIPELSDIEYGVASFTYWSAPLERSIGAKQRFEFGRDEWLTDGDIACVTKAATAMGWHDELPPPFAMTSGRRFDLPPNTVALHPGCKPGWPWKKWHGFDELAALFSSVVVVGTKTDSDNSRTYFGHSFEWPEHVRDFTGALDLPDTAALIAQCNVLVSNDSGLMHLGVALGVPTFGIFGITSPARECIPSPFMHAITKQLPCEAACRRLPWGRRDCDRHLECLKMLTSRDVFDEVVRSVPNIGKPAIVEAAPTATTITLNYYGEVSDSSGYGHAARTYVHALHAAGIRVHVINTGQHSPQIHDELIESLSGNDPDADFNVFHGIPPMWARSAYPLRNVIAVTVWETDRMPQSWRGALTHAIDVWLPCRFNVDVFDRDLRRATFLWPHAVSTPSMDKATENEDITERFGVRSTDFVFYSIFEWQPRKNPRGVIDAFLLAFPAESDAVLFIKSSPRSAGEAARTLEQARQATRSNGRVVLCCESLSETELESLHRRGNAYISMHRGEGWGYPLFDAACHGKPIVATEYSGPLDYLDRNKHWLIRQRPTSVHQSYIFYHPFMRWAEPDISHASEGLRWIYEHRLEACTAADEAAKHIRNTYSLSHVGAMARTRLIELLKKTNPEKHAAIVAASRATKAPTALPIAAEWYDADYFEHGIKSNWHGGYTWPLFKGLFEETAAYLAEIFPGAKRFLDAGCAKGFLVEALRGRELDARGFDHSRWAVTNVNPAVKPYVELASTESISFEDDAFDVTVAMFLLESLTEEQITHFLIRARAWTREALIATISINDSQVSEPATDGDLSHITLRTREWWCKCFLEAGWRQDPLHRTFERVCQGHALPKKMGWNVFLFSPG